MAKGLYGAGGQTYATEKDSRRVKLEVLRAQLENERSTFLSHWRDLGDHILPRRPRFFTTDTNKGDRRNQKITDITPTLAIRTLASGMMAGITSPARPWFRLTTPDPDLGDIGAVKEWLDVVTRRMGTVFLRSNLYNTLPVVYKDLGCFGTAAMSIEEDFEDTIRTYPFPIGSYSISNSDQLKVDVFFREFQMTVRQIVSKFGKRGADGEIDWSNISTHVRNMWDMHNRETWIDVCHVVQPNDEYDPRKIQSKFKKFASTYYEKGFSENQTGNYLSSSPYDVALSEKGYDLFGILAPRWELTGEDSYATSCPGMDALGDIKQLMLGEKRIMQAAEKGVNPPMTAPTSLRTQKASILPGDITFVDIREGQQGFRSAHEVRFDVSHMEQKQAQIRQRISRAFYEDLFLMLANSDRRQITAREIEERHEEKLLALGPVLEQLNQDLLDPLIDNTFDIMLRQGQIPRPPDELQGVKLKVEYISIMAQAQKLAGLSGIERFTQFAGQVAQVDPSIIDKINRDKLIDVYAEITGIPADIVNTPEEVADIRAARQQQQAAASAPQVIKDMSAGAKNLSETNLEGDNALARLLKQAQAGQAVPS
jgi:hypothetical protein